MHMHCEQALSNPEWKEFYVVSMKRTEEIHDVAITSILFKHLLATTLVF